MSRRATTQNTASRNNQATAPAGSPNDATRPANAATYNANPGLRWSIFRAPSPPPPPLSDFSSPAVANSGWCSMNFMFGAGMVIIQPSTQKVVVVHDARTNTYFFPRGRKDVGESLEATALREGFEESGYQAEFLPLWNPTEAPSPPDDPDARYQKNTEPVFVTLTSWKPSRPGRRGRRLGGEYITSWYVGQIPPDAVRQEGTGMPDEQEYTSDLYTFQEASELVYGSEKEVLEYAFAVYKHTLDKDEELAREGADANHTRRRRATAQTTSSTTEPST